MKKTLLLIAFCAILSTSSIAQNFSSGLKGGFNFSSLYIDEVEDRQIRPGFHAGIFTSTQLAGPLGFQAELLFTTAGNRTNYEVGILDYEVDFNFNYLQIPVMLQLNLGNVFTFNGGLYGAYLVGGNVTYEGDLGNSTSELDRDEFTKLDYGFVLGGGYNINNVQFGLRYNLGLRDVADSDDARDQVGDVKNVVGQIYMAIKLGGN